MVTFQIGDQLTYLTPGGRVIACVCTAVLDNGAIWIAQESNLANVRRVELDEQHRLTLVERPTPAVELAVGGTCPIAVEQVAQDAGPPAELDADVAAQLSTLVQTSAGPAGRRADWDEIAVCDTGERWYRRVLHGDTVYRWSDGATVRYYAPAALVAQWDDVTYAHACSPSGWSMGDPIAVAWSIICDHDQGDDMAVRLVQRYGLEHYLTIVRSQELLLTAGDEHDAQQADRYGIPYVVGQPLEIVPSITSTQMLELARMIDPQSRLPFTFFRTPDGRILARRSPHDPLRVLPPEQAALVESVVSQ